MSHKIKFNLNQGQNKKPLEEQPNEKISISINSSRETKKKIENIDILIPCISDTIDFSSFISEFKRDDFPEFGLPIIATGIPSLNTLPYL